MADSIARSRSRSASASEILPSFRSRIRSRTQAGRGRLPMTVVGKWRVGMAGLLAGVPVGVQTTESYSRPPRRKRNAGWVRDLILDRKEGYPLEYLRRLSIRG